MPHLLSAGRDKVISHFSRWLERGQERTLKPVLRTAEVNENLSLPFNRPLNRCQWPVPYQAGRVSTDSIQTTWNAGAELWNPATETQAPFSLHVCGAL